MAKIVTEVESLDPVWDQMVIEAKHGIEQEPLLGAMIHSSILHHDNLDQALSYRIALK